MTLLGRRPVTLIGAAILSTMRFGILGPLAVWTDDGEPVTVPGLKVRALLADLLVNAGRPVSVDRLVEDLWGDAAPSNPAAALHVRVSQLRRALDDAEPGARELVVSRAPGYALVTTAVDAVRFGELVGQTRDAADPRSRARLLADALGSWRGPALADFADTEFAGPAIARWEEQRLVALELHADARLELGDHDALAGELADLVQQHPFRESLRAAHLRALYRAGRQREALDSYDDLRRRLADELGLDPGPGLAALRQAILEQDPALTAQPVRPPGPARRATNLSEPPALIGRDAARRSVSTLVETERLVTLTGPGGVGKTRLATAVAHPLAGAYPDGAYLVELAALERPHPDRAVDDLAELVMATLHVHDAADTGGRPTSPADRLAAVLENRQLLLVMDNCEHLVAPAATLTDRLLRAAPGLRVLATSREPLGLTGEVVWDVPTLDVPAAEADLGQLAESDAVRLFVARAAAAARGFTLDEESGPAVAQLCRRLDGIPLALELAATRVRTLGVHGLVDRLHDRFRALGTGPRDVPARQRTLTATIDWSWHLLDPPDQVVLRRLAVSADGCTLAAAEAVCADPDTDVLDVLARLVDRSLVVMDDRGGHGPRYRLLESVGAYALNRLHEAGEHARVRLRHAEHYAELAAQADEHLRGPRQREWLRRLDTESPNLRSALDTAVRLGDAELALRLTGALTWYWFLRGRLGEARRAVAAALAVPGDSPPEVRGHALAWHTGLGILQGDHRDWAERCEAALRPFDESTHAGWARARAEWFLAYATFGLGDLAVTVPMVDRAAKAFEAAGDRWGEAATLVLRAGLAHVRGDLATLDHDAGRAAAVFRDLGDRWGALNATDWLIGLADMTGDYDRAARLGHDGLPLAEELGLWPDVAGFRSWLGWIAVQTGDNAVARDHCEQALRLAAEHGMQAAQVFAGLGLAFAARRAGDLDVAQEQLEQLRRTGEQQSAEAGTAYYLSMVLNELGYLAAQRGDGAAALDLHLRAYDLSYEMAAGRDLSFALEGAAAALALTGRGHDAAVVLGAAEVSRRGAELPPSPAERRELDRVVAAVRAVQDEAAFAAAFTDGGRLTLEAARELAGRPSAACLTSGRRPGRRCPTGTASGRPASGG